MLNNINFKKIKFINKISFIIIIFAAIFLFFILSRDEKISCSKQKYVAEAIKNDPQLKCILYSKGLPADKVENVFQALFKCGMASAGYAKLENKFELALENSSIEVKPLYEFLDINNRTATCRSHVKWIASDWGTAEFEVKYKIKKYNEKLDIEIMR